MSRSRPRVVSRCSFHTASAVSKANMRRARSPRPSFSPSRRAKSTPISQSGRASPGWGNGRADAADASLGVGHGAVLFAPGGGRQQEIGEGAGLGAHEGFLHHHEFRGSERFVHQGLVGHRLRRVGAGDPHRLISPALSALKSSTALLPGASGTLSTPHSAATSARCAGLAGRGGRTADWRGRRLRVRPWRWAGRSARRARRRACRSARWPGAG